MFLHPFGLLALLAVPAVVGLHLFRRRFQPRVVSAVFLWDTLDRAAVAGRKREPLHRSASFWCELFAALLLGLAVAGPRGCGVGEAQHLVVVLDASASMAATIEGESAIDRARQKIEDRLEALPRGSRATLIASG
ncbi:MAG: Ca-activated chloride channel family protein, partial [Planctomycetota bacterium]